MKSSSKKKQRKDTSSRGMIEDGLSMGIGPSIPLSEETRCKVCNGLEHEDMALLCDGKDCQNEFHMYCLSPLITVIPSGEWLCPLCDHDGQTQGLRNYFREHEEFRKNWMFNFPSDFVSWLSLLQGRIVNFSSWKPLSNLQVVCSEFDTTSEALAGN